ncbi:MAG TPA: hypothetical protein GX702_00765 [Chloroflexi bacterium]|jgi:nucleoside-triphosphatase THEP1|nr:hypothetical protein [Chloroflexota bacterium]
MPTDKLPVCPSEWTAVSPSALLESILLCYHTPCRVIVTGQRGAGKSTWCDELLRLAVSQGWQVAGVWSPAVFEKDVKVGIDMVGLPDGERRRLAVLRRDGDTNPFGMRWSFDDETIAWGNAVLANTDAPDLLMIDELGPLEFEHGQGLTEGLRAVDRRRYRLAVIVIRPELLAEALRRWPDARVVTPPNRER